MMADVILSLVLIALSAVWIAEGIRLGLWIPGVSAGSGFIPAAFAALTLVSSLFVIASALKKRKQEPETGKEETAAWKEQWKTLIPVVFCLGGIVSLQLFGLVITVFAISFLWMYFVSRLNWKKVLLFSCAITLFIFLVFEFWLKIPFPGDIIKL